MIPALFSADKSTTVRSKSGLRMARTTLRAAFTVSEGLGARAAARLFTMPRRHRRPARELPILDDGRRFTLPVLRRAPYWGGEEIAVTAWQWGQGPAVLLVHGWEGRGAQLGALVAPLVDAGMSVVAFDAPGHGDSPGSRLFLSDMADCVGQLAEHLGGIHAVIAHSFGCAATMLAHREYGTDAPRNVFLAPAAMATRAVGGFAELLALEERDEAALRQRLAVESGVRADDLSVSALASDRDAGLLIIHDQADPEVSFEQAQLLATHWPAAQLIATEGLGHRRLLRDPEVVRDAVAYAIRSAPIGGSDLARVIQDGTGGDIAPTPAR
jgi:pimeloyl-ACP methyl ester carboxylesterase